MDKYRLILIGANNGNDYVCQHLYLARDFEMLELTKEMNFNVPVGYNVAASLQNIKLILEDAYIVRNAFFRHGVNLRQKIRVERRNATHTDYNLFFEAYIDPQTVVVQGELVEFAVSLNENQRNWFEKSKVEMFFEASEFSTMDFPSMRLLNVIIGSGSIFAFGTGIGTPAHFQNKNSRIYDENVSGFGVVPQPPQFTTQFPRLFSIIQPTGQTRSFQLQLDVAGITDGNFQVRLRHRQTIITDGNPATSHIYTFVFPLFLSHGGGSGNFQMSGTFSVFMPSQTVGENQHVENSFEIMVVGSNGRRANVDFSMISAGFFLDASTTPFSAPAIVLTDILEQIRQKHGIDWQFTGRGVQARETLDNFRFISGDMIGENRTSEGKLGFYAKPYELLIDFCKIMAYTFYFDRNDVLLIVPLENVFSGQQRTAIQYAKNVQYSYVDETIFSGVEIGYNTPSLDYPTFRQNFAEKLTYYPTQRGGEAMFDLVCRKLRIDYAGILLQRFYFEQNPLQGDPQRQYKDVWMVHTAFENGAWRPTTAGITTQNIMGGGEFNVALSPLRMLSRWMRYLSTIFGRWNASPNDNPQTLELSGEENIVNDMRSVVPFDPNWTGNTAEKTPIHNLTQERFFTPIQAKLTGIANITDLHTLGLVDFDGRPNNLLKSAESTESFEDVEVTVLMPPDFTN